MPIHFVGKVHRRGTPVVAKAAGKRHARNCRSAPAVPTGLTLNFARREMGRVDRWRAVARWNPVTLDVAGRAVGVEGYQAQLQMTDASGEPSETNLQAEAAIESGAGFTVHAGSAAVNGISRELNASPDEIKKTLTGLTTGIECAVNFYAKEDLVGSAPRLRFKIWNVTDGTETIAKNETMVSLSSRIYATLPFTPVAGKTYEARVSWVSGSGIGLLEYIQWHDRGDIARWTQMVPDDENPLAALWANIPRPKTGYFQARVRTLNRIHGARCWSAWTAWTTPTVPATGALSGPPAPAGLVLTFDKVEGVRGNRTWRAKGRVNQSPQWTPPDGEPTDIEDYVFQLEVSSESDGTPLLNRRRGLVVEHDPEQTYARQEWHQILGKRYYRARAKARSIGRPGAWTSWTTWISPGGLPNPPTGITVTNPTPAVALVKWVEPVDLTDVDRYRVQVIRANDSSVVDDGYTDSNRWLYHIPAGDRGINHRARVRSIEDPGSLEEDEVAPAGWATESESSLLTSSDATMTAVWTSAEAPPSDGLVPTSHPAATVQGGPGWILAKWTAISNADAVTYDVYVSATDLGSTVAAWTATTKLGSVDGTFHFITKTGAGSALAYGTTYFVALIAKDRDGTATAALPTRGSAAMVKIPTVDVSTGAITANEVAANTLTAGEIAANAITASEIAANAVTASKLEATLVLATMLKAVGAGGRVEIDAAGIRLYNATSGGTNTVNLKSSDGSAWFEGEVRTSGTKVIDPTTGLRKCRAEYTSGGTILDTVQTYVRFGTEVVDTLNCHQLTTDALNATPSSAYFFDLPDTGFYQVLVQASFSTNNAGRRIIGIDLDGVLEDSASVFPHPSASTRMNATFWIQTSGAQQISVFLTCATGGTNLTIPGAKIGIVYLGT